MIVESSAIRVLLDAALTQAGMRMGERELHELAARINEVSAGLNMSNTYLYEKVYLHLDRKGVQVSDKYLHAVAKFAGYQSYDDFLVNHSTDTKPKRHSFMKYKGILKSESFDEVERQLAQMRSEWS